MHVFMDRHGKRWAVELTVGSAKRCRNLTGVDINKLAENRFKPLAELLEDVVLLADVLYCLSKPLDSQPADDVSFGEGLAGDSIDQAADAFCKAICDFFPTPAQRQAIATVVKAMRRVQTKLAARQEQQQASFDLEKETDKIVEQLWSEAKSSSNSASTAPAGSDSTPTPGPSTNS